MLLSYKYEDLFRQLMIIRSLRGSPNFLICLATEEEVNSYKTDVMVQQSEWLRLKLRVSLSLSLSRSLTLAILVNTFALIICASDQMRFSISKALRIKHHWDE